MAVAEGECLVAAACAGCTPEGAAALLHGLERNTSTTVPSAAPADAAPADVAAASSQRPVGAAPASQAASEEVRAVLAVPMEQEGARLGLVALARREARPFTGLERQRLEALAELASLAVGHVRRIEALRRAGREG